MLNTEIAALAVHTAGSAGMENQDVPYRQP